MIASKEQMQAIKDRNFNAVCEYLKSGCHSSIGAIAKSIGISVPTVTKVVNYGLELGVFVDTQVFAATGGRNAQLYKINAEYALTINLNIFTDGIKYRIYDFTDNEIKRNEFSCDVSEVIDKAIDIIKTETTLNNKIKYCAISMPCVLRDGKILDWGSCQDAVGTNMHQKLLDACNIDCIIENDMKILSYASAKKYVQNFESSTVLTLMPTETFLGLGTVMDGKVLSGKNSFAGEVSYITDNNNDSIIDSTIKVLLNAITLISPSSVVIYDRTGKSAVDTILGSVKHIIPDYAMPDFHRGDDFCEDIFSCLVYMTEKKKKFIGCP